MTRHLKKLDFWFTLYGTKFGIPICCVIWFETCWITLRADNDLNDWYGDVEFQGYDTSRLQGGDERIMCPECVVKAMRSKSK